MPVTTGDARVRMQERTFTARAVRPRVAALHNVPASKASDLEGY